MAENKILMPPDELWFRAVLGDVAKNTEKKAGIGSLAEKKLHLILKKYFEPDDAYHEVSFEGYVADIKCGSSIIEVQTSGFGRMRPKLEVFLRDCHVNIVYPIYEKKHIVWMDTHTGEITRRASPRHEKPAKILSELVYVLDYLNDPRLTFTAVSLAVDEYRLLDGWGEQKKRRATKLERIPTGIISITSLHSPADYLELLGNLRGRVFTSSQFGSETGLAGRRRSGAIKALLSKNVIKVSGKQKNAILYESAL